MASIVVTSSLVLKILKNNIPIVDANHRNVLTIISFDGLRFLFKCLADEFAGSQKVYKPSLGCDHYESTLTLFRVTAGIAFVL